MWYMGTHMGNWWWLGFLFYFIVFVGIIILIVFLVRGLSSSKSQGLPPPKEEPLEILKKRYAKGEITKEQYQQMKKDIES